MSFQRENLKFGNGSFVGEALNDASFYQLPIRDQAKIVGWSVGCPVVDELTDPENPMPGRGPEAMLPRYGEIAFWAGYINRSAQEFNPALHSQLVQSVERWADEPVGKHEPESVPSNYTSVIPPTETLVGYTLPRLLTKQLGESEVPTKDKQDRLVSGLDILERSIIAAKSPEELLALSAEGMAQANVDPITTLSTVLSTGWYGEHNANHMVDNLKVALQASAPHLWNLYTSLSVQDRVNNKLL